MTRSVTLAFALVGLAVFRIAAGEPPSAPEEFRIGVSRASFGNVHRNDASAALKVWADTAFREGRLPIEVKPEVFETLASLREGLAKNSIQGVSLTTEEFFQLGEQPAFIFLIHRDQTCTWQYVILTHREGNLADLASLRGRRFAIHDSPIMGPAKPWLETLLADQGLGPAEKFLGETTGLDTPSKAVLRVFFKQAEACLVTSQAFETSCEMNPLLRRQLRAIATSPPLVSGLFYFRDSYVSTYRERVEGALLDLHTTRFGQQVLTVFQGSSMQRYPAAFLDTTRQLYERHARLVESTGTPPERAADSPPPNPKGGLPPPAAEPDKNSARLSAKRPHAPDAPPRP